MSRRWDLLRLDYAFSVLVPCVLAIYINKLSLWAHLDIIIAFLLYAVTGNTLNDAIDMRDPKETETIERVKGYHWKEIATIGIISWLFGTMLFVRTVRAHPINGLYLGLTIIMVIVYCLKKTIPILNQILLGISHILFPYLIIKTDAGLTSPLLTQIEWVAMLMFLLFAFAGQVVHEIIDGDAISKYSMTMQQRVVFISSGLTMVAAAFTVWFLQDIYFIPLVLVPIGSIYTFRRPTKSTAGVKDVGILMGNFILLYLLVLILQRLLV